MTETNTESQTNNALASVGILLVMLAGGIGTFMIVQGSNKHGIPVALGGTRITESSARVRVGGLAETDLDPEPTVDVAWLLTFPHSGTSYTLVNIESLTDIAHGDGYAGTTYKKQVTRNGPFYGNGKRMDVSPNQFLLTKSHCGTGTCRFCRLGMFGVDSKTFEMRCRTTERHYSLDKQGHEIECRKPTHTKQDQGGIPFCDQKRTGLHPISVVKRAAHLMRHPVDNVVSRLHVDLRYNWKQLEEKHPADFWGDETLTDREQIVAYCKLLDETYGQELVDMIESDATDVSEMPMCFSEFYSYLNWHGNALEMLERLQKERESFPVLHFFYEDYASNYNKTVENLLDFVNQPMRGWEFSKDFIAGKTYVNLFTEAERDQIFNFIQRHASPKLWSVLNGRYSLLP